MTTVKKTTRSLLALTLGTILLAPAAWASDEEARVAATQECTEEAEAEAIAQDEREAFIAECVEEVLAESKN
jgi:hypothetical protein